MPAFSSDLFDPNHKFSERLESWTAAALDDWNSVAQGDSMLTVAIFEREGRKRNPDKAVITPPNLVASLSRFVSSSFVLAKLFTHSPYSAR